MSDKILFKHMKRRLLILMSWKVNFLKISTIIQKLKSFLFILLISTGRLLSENFINSSDFFCKQNMFKKSKTWLNNCFADFSKHHVP